MPCLTACSPEEWEAVLPGFRKKLKASAFRPYGKAMRNQMERGIIPGYSCLVICGDEVIHVDACGYADMETKTPMRTDTIVRLYCMTKSIVATALMVLVERGCCALEDDVANYIPLFSNVRVVAKPSNDISSANDKTPNKKVTLRHLLCHCSGLGYGQEFNFPPHGPAETYHELVLGVESGRLSSIASFCDELAELPLWHKPGEQFEYSYGLDVLGRVIEVVSGFPLDVFLKKTLFGPLGMQDTSFSVPKEKLPRLAALYGSIGTAKALGDAEPNQELPPGAPEWSLTRLDGQRSEDSAWTGRNGTVLSAGGFMGHNRGGLVSTLNDQARFFLMIAHGGKLPGGPQILKEDTVQEMVGRDWLRLPECLGEPQLNTGLSGVTASGAFGWNALGELGIKDEASQSSKDEFELHEYGYAGIAGTFWSINPTRDLIVLWFSQQVDNHSWTSDAGNLWLAARQAVSVANVVKAPMPIKRKHGCSRPPATATKKVSGAPLAEASEPPPRRHRLTRKTADLLGKGRG
eukprot:TRINITY_DN27938_c0_g1_i1.p1 TRINITY_DN27938_c0_g1~~TRINITY_DN27938_c0_g1_i1.p1  ORF type:complete len:520 (+),score=77.53 TRINITY_DN27938_c0_g1_i1:54-1613(+)